ncbi:uncharacterized protein TOT_040000657 [Theileria orientalis strain Shintoku]|uniref:MIF4G domain-containing protein n=1 Tax=Theileria orientalis strain Shintoku TaxID=869250 RepID=J4C9C3_THEOR|nr:uncharacterized protein TOT_040000657 [Theileria orientalis strain Shintoku]BAM42288.1 uncharacterized protein TOT_040000657 [Theileria orientalis strain Shintoku]|eukprot:XP_009692589.1 uncharacterized protein TOT_040000657 [Theileria orientalis strain Shintoku]
MTVSKTGSQETTGKSRSGSNSLNPDAPEFNPTTKSSGKLNADAPEFVPGQIPQFDPRMVNGPEIKGGYKNGHMPSYRLSQQDQYLPMWIAQPYPVHHYQMYPDNQMNYIPYDYARQTQNYPIQRNVYPTPVHNDYNVNMPYNMVVQGKAKMTNKTAKTKSNNKDGVPSKEGQKEKEPPVNSARDSMSVATTKDTTRDTLTSVREPAPQPPKQLTWAERTKLSTTRQLPKQTVVTTLGGPTTAPPQVTTQVQVPRPAVPEPIREVPKEIRHQQGGQKQQLGTHREQPEVSKRGAGASGSHQNAGKVAAKTLSTSAEVAGRAEEKTEQISYAKVFKEAVRSTALKQASAAAKEGALEHAKHAQDLRQTSKRNEAAAVDSAKPESKPSATVTQPTQTKHTTPQHLAQTEAQEQSQTEPHTNHTKPQTDLTQEREERKDVVPQKEDEGRKEDPCTHDSTGKREEGREDSREDTGEDAKEEPREQKDYSVEAMLRYYLYLLSNKNMVDEIRERYSLPHIKFLTTSQTSTKNSFKERERQEKTEKKDWRHKSYDKNFGNFRFNKEFTRSEPTQQIMASEGSWLMKQAKQKRDKEVQMRKKILGLLNKLTFEKFDVIYNQIIQCGIDTPEHAELLVKFVFDKAVTQHHFIPMYVELCAKLSVDLFTIESSTAKKEAHKQPFERQATEQQAAERQLAEQAAEQQAAERQLAEQAAEQQAAERQLAEKGSPEQEKQRPGQVSEEKAKVGDKVAEEAKAPAEIKQSSEEAAESSIKLTSEEAAGETSRTVDSTTTVDTVHHTESSQGFVEPKHGPTRAAGETREYARMSSDSSSASGCEEEAAERAYPQGELEDHEKSQVEQVAVDRLGVDRSGDTTHTAKEYAQVAAEAAPEAAQKTEQQSNEQQEAKSTKRSDFIRILLSCSQDSFEDNLKPLEIPSDLEGDDRFEYEQKYKHKMRGNMMFVGELFKQKLLAAKLLITCLDQVFMKREECILLYNDINMGNNHLEAMCTLLQTVGRSFDTNRWKLISDFEKRIQHLEELGKNEQISFRIRCLIKNVLDRRMEHWDKSIYQSQDQPCKLQEFRHKHSVTSFAVGTVGKEKGEKQEQVEEAWRVRSKKKTTTSTTSSTTRGERSRREGNRSYSKESDQRSQSDLNSDDQMEALREESEEEEKLARTAKSIVNELVMSYDTEESTLRVAEMNVQRTGEKRLYKALVVACMEACSKVNAEKQTDVVTTWIVGLAKERGSLESMLDGLHEFAFGEDEASLEMLADDFPLLPRTLRCLLSKMRPECGESEKYKQVESKV